MRKIFLFKRVGLMKLCADRFLCIDCHVRLLRYLRTSDIESKTSRYTRTNTGLNRLLIYSICKFWYQRFYSNPKNIFSTVFDIGTVLEDSGLSKNFNLIFGVGLAAFVCLFALMIATCVLGLKSKKSQVGAASGWIQVDSLM